MEGIICWRTWIISFITKICLTALNKIQSSSIASTFKDLEYSTVFDGLERGRKGCYKLFLLSESLIQTYCSEKFRKKRK